MPATEGRLTLEHLPTEPGDPGQRLGPRERAVQANCERSPLDPHLDYSFRIVLLYFLGLLLIVILKLACFCLFVFNL